MRGSTLTMRGGRGGRRCGTTEDSRGLWGGGGGQLL